MVNAEPNFPFLKSKTHDVQKTMKAIKDTLRNEFEVVGLTERFDETLLMLQDAGILGNITYKAKHKYLRDSRPEFKELPLVDQEAIRRHNNLDQEIYDFAKKLFQERVDKAGPEFQRKLREHQKRQEVVQSLHGSLCEDDVAVFGNWKCDSKKRHEVKRKRFQEKKIPTNQQAELLQHQMMLNDLKALFHLESRYW